MTNILNISRKTALLLFVGMFSSPSHANSERDIKFLLQAKHPPPGVVFEVLENQETDLVWVIPLIKRYAGQLREKYPHIKIAVVSHGREEFGLLKENQEKYQATHLAVKSLVDDAIPLHVCGTHASWNNKAKEDFPDYVDVVPEGPAQLSHYVREGYDLVVIDKPD